MKAKTIIIAIVGFLLLVTSGLGAGLLPRALSRGEPVVILRTPVPPLPVIDAERIAYGAQLYQQHCASCHGANLEGAADWKTPLDDGAFPPPPHDSSGHTWHHTDTLLLEIISNGGNQTLNSRMPAYKDKLSTDEMVAILDFIKSYW